MNTDAARTYRTQQLVTATPAQRVAMLYDKVIGSLKEAVRAIDRGDIEGRWKANRAAFEIINHLSLTLDHDRGGEIAANLDQLYRFILAKLPEVDLHNDPAPARDSIRLLEPIAAAWRQLAGEAPCAAEPQAAAPSTTAADNAGAVGDATRVLLSA